MQPTSVPTEQAFKQLCLRLRNADPKVWEQFLQCFDTYTIEVMSQMATAPSEAILNMQGRAQQCKALLRIFAECHIQKHPPQPQPAPTTWAP
jgi:hypothetical protein